jgi:hypothetical protein
MTTHVYYEIHNDRIQFVQYTERSDARIYWIGGDKQMLVERGKLTPPEAIHDLVAPQELMDELWRLGYRPAESVGTAGHVAALQAHIKFAEGVTGALLERLSPSANPEQK